VDADDRCLAPLDGALGGASFLSWHEAHGTLGNNFFAVRPRHEAIGEALQEATDAILRGDEETIWLTTGSGLLTRAVARYLEPGMAVRGRPGDPDLEGTVVLRGWQFRRFCVPGCRASYKQKGRH
jgi:mannosyltransferase OCH1-like enzyme